MNKVMRPEFKEGRGEFTRKGEVGDWINHFDETTNQVWNAWIQENLGKIGITEEEHKGWQSKFLLLTSIDVIQHILYKTNQCLIIIISI